MDDRLRRILARQREIEDRMKAKDVTSSSSSTSGFTSRRTVGDNTRIRGEIESEAVQSKRWRKNAAGQWTSNFSVFGDYFRSSRESNRYQVEVKSGVLSSDHYHELRISAALERTSDQILATEALYDLMQHFWLKSSFSVQASMWKDVELAYQVLQDDSPSVVGFRRRITLKKIIHCATECAAALLKSSHLHGNERESIKQRHDQLSQKLLALEARPIIEEEDVYEIAFSESCFRDVPVEIYFHIFRYLEFSDLFRLPLVCKGWYLLISSAQETMYQQCWEQHGFAKVEGMSYYTCAQNIVGRGERMAGLCVCKDCKRIFWAAENVKGSCSVFLEGRKWTAFRRGWEGRVLDKKHNALFIDPCTISLNLEKKTPKTQQTPTHFVA